MSLIKIKNASKIYGDVESGGEALKNISLEFEKEEFVAIVGVSGSGKSILLHMIGAVDQLTSGEIEIDGVNIIK